MNENTTTEDPTRVKLALKAADIITGDRQSDYGPPEVNFQRIANLWNDHMETKMFTPRKVAELMLLLKIARTVNSPTEDSYVDLIGYAALAGEMAETEREGPKEDIVDVNNLSVINDIQIVAHHALNKAQSAEVQAAAVAAQLTSVSDRLSSNIKNTEF